MQDKKEKVEIIKAAIGKIFTGRKNKSSNISLSNFALGYGIDKGTLSKIERGVYDLRISTAILTAEAYGMKFSEFAILLEKELGEDFKFFDD